MYWITPVDEPYRITQGYYTPWIFAPWKWHRALDYSKPIGSPIYAAQEGTVKREGYMKDYGYMIEIDHGGTYTTLYAHLKSRSNKSVNDHVNPAEQIGSVGSTGLSTGPHLHFEMRIGGTKVNPEKYNFITRETYMDLEREINLINERLDNVFEYAIKNDKEKKGIVEDMDTFKKNVRKKLDNRFTKKQTKELIKENCK